MREAIEAAESPASSLLSPRLSLSGGSESDGWKTSSSSLASSTEGHCECVVRAALAEVMTS